MRSKAKALGDSVVVNHIEKQIFQAEQFPKLVPNIIHRLEEAGLDAYVQDFRVWFDAYERSEELKG